MKTISAILGLIAVSAISAQEVVEAEGFQGLGDIRHHQIESKFSGKRYEFLVGLPDSYSESPDTAYPTIYLTDGAALYPLLQGYNRYLNFAEEVPQAIFIAISYSDADWVNGSDRSHDYSAPSEEREDYGGAGDFQSMLRDEIMPLVEEQYRSRADRRIIFGQSMGGQFVMFTAHTDPDLFWGHIASNPALHRNLSFYLPANTKVPAKPSTKLFVGSASDNDPRYKVPASQWIGEWAEQAQKPWELQVEILAGHNHFSAAPASFRRGMKWLFPNPAAP
jgi:predicted alpha/beta superfamily hydrolase